MTFYICTNCDDGELIAEGRIKYRKISGRAMRYEDRESDDYIPICPRCGAEDTLDEAPVCADCGEQMCICVAESGEPERLSG